MKYKGYNLKVSETIGWRFAKEGDVDLQGSPIPLNFIVFVNKDALEFVDTIPAIPVFYNDVNSGCGQPIQKDGDKEIDGITVSVYWDTPIYLMHGQTVYTGHIYSKD
jgi:hypothetical protein